MQYNSQQLLSYISTQIIFTVLSFNNQFEDCDWFAYQGPNFTWLVSGILFDLKIRL